MFLISDFNHDDPCFGSIIFLSLARFAASRTFRSFSHKSFCFELLNILPHHISTAPACNGYEVFTST